MKKTEMTEAEAEAVEAERKALEKTLRKRSRGSMWGLVIAIVAAPLLMVFWRTLAAWVVRIGADSGVLFVVIGVVLLVAGVVVFWPVNDSRDSARTHE